MTPEELQELKRLHELISANRKQWSYAAWTEYEALEKKWAPIDTTGMLLDEVERWKKECEKLISLRSPMGQGESFSRLDEIIHAMKILKEQRDGARAEIDKLRKVAEAAQAYMECAECRGDEDCDHCVLMQALAELEGKK